MKGAVTFPAIVVLCKSYLYVGIYNRYIKTVHRLERNVQGQAINVEFDQIIPLKPENCPL